MKLARWATGFAVLAVAVIAAVVSFGHIETLALAHGQPVAAARLLPLSVDGLIVAASLTLLTESRARREAPRLARAGLALGVAATVLANVAYGTRYGIVGAVISAWPAIAFIISTEILVGQMRRARGIPTREAGAGTVADGVPHGVPGDVPVIEPMPVPEIASVAVTASTVPPAPGGVPRTVATGRARGRAQARAPEKVFAAEISRGELPSLRAIKSRARCGTDRARVIRDHLSELLPAAHDATQVQARR